MVSSRQAREKGGLKRPLPPADTIAPALQLQGRGRFLLPDRLGLFNSDGAFFANFDATFTAKAFFRIDRLGLAVNHLEYFDRTNINTLFTANTFVFVHNGIKSHLVRLLSYGIYNKSSFNFYKRNRSNRLYQLPKPVKPCSFLFFRSAIQKK
jgi:hypothetical protein